MKPHKKSRPFVSRLLLTGLIAGIAFAGGCEKSESRPSVLLIIIDTLRVDHVGYFGVAPDLTPNMNRLSGSGVAFSQCITAVPVTLPSVSSILTSTYPVYHGVRDNGTFTLDESLTSMAELFADAGYSTAAVVGAYVLAEGTGIEQGFRHFDSDFGGKYHLESSLAATRAREISETQRRADEVTDRALDWLAEGHEPFFLVVHYFDPHSPYDPPPPFTTRFSTNKYAGEIAYTDGQLGRLLEAVESVSAENGLITVLMADHGEGLGQHGEKHHGFFVYDSTLLVPLIVYFPGRVPPGFVFDEQVSTVDVAPTILELAGLTIPDSWQGTSLAQRISMRPLGEEGAPPAPGPRQDPACYVETYRTRYSYQWSELIGLRYDGWKIIRAPKPELYDLRTDPGETNNLYGGNPQQAERMEEFLDEFISRREGPLKDRGPNQELDDSAVSKLKALGYVMSTTTHTAGPLPDPKDKIVELNRRFDSKDHVKAAQAFLAKGDLDAAEKELRVALDLDPRNANAVHDLGLVAWRRGQTDEALPLLEEATRLDSSKIEPRRSLAAAYMNLNRFEDAARELGAAVAIQPDDFEARLLYGTALERTGDLEGALGEFNKCIELAPDQAGPYFGVAQVLVRLGRKSEAKKRLEEMLIRQPSGPQAQQARKLLEELGSAG